MQIIPSLIDRDIYFLFRDNNEEIMKLNKLNETQLKDVELKIDKLLNLTQ